MFCLRLWFEVEHQTTAECGQNKAEIEQRIRGSLRWMKPHRIQHINQRRSCKDKRHHVRRPALKAERKNNTNCSDSAQSARDGRRWLVRLVRGFECRLPRQLQHHQYRWRDHQQQRHAANGRGDGDRWSASLFVRNLTDEHVPSLRQAGFPVSGFPQYGQFLTEASFRMVGLALETNF